MSPVLRTFVLATIAVPIVIYGLMPYLHRLRVRLLATADVGLALKHLQHRRRGLAEGRSR